MGVAHTLARSFFWSENILWKEDLAEHPTTVFLAGQDLIVNTKAVAAYLRDTQSAPSEVTRGLKLSGMHPVGDGDRRSRGIAVVWGEELDHASIFDSPKRRRTLVDTVLEHCRDAVLRP